MTLLLAAALLLVTTHGARECIDVGNFAMAAAQHRDDGWTLGGYQEWIAARARLDPVVSAAPDAEPLMMAISASIWRDKRTPDALRLHWYNACLGGQDT